MINMPGCDVKMTQTQLACHTLESFGCADKFLALPRVLVGTLIIIGVMHNHAHYGYVNGGKLYNGSGC